VGVYEQGFPKSPKLIQAFAAAAGVRPRLAGYYSGWGEPFKTSFAAAVHGTGAVPVVQLQPDGVKLTAIASGAWDKYLHAYAEAVKKYAKPVILGFAHEMNWTWHAQGSGRAAPQEFTAAWQHVVTIFRQAGANNAKWMWTVAAVTSSGPWIGEWWPGARWVDIVGVDGYYYHPSSTFASVFGQTLRDVREFTDSPVLISAVGIGKNASRSGQISGLFAGARSAKIGAVIWFDVTQHGGTYHQDWRLEGDSAALASFKAGAALGTRGS
jgi:hypothetical protein